MQLFYKIIYFSSINFVLRNLNRFINTIFNTSILLPPSGKLKFSIEEKKMIIKTNQTNYLTQIIYWHGIESFEYTSIFIQLSKQINTFFDIGANIGYYSIIAGVVNPKIKITAFEPAKGPLFYLNENKKLNHLEHLKIESIALSNQIGTIDFYEIQNRKYSYLAHNLGGEGNTGSKKTGRNFKINKVETCTLDQYVKLNTIGEIDLIKMDTEGTEHFILQSARYVLSVFKPIIICETLFGKNENELENILNQFEYEFYNYVSNGLQRTTTLVRTQDDGIYNRFFVHPTKKHIIEPFIF